MDKIREFTKNNKLAVISLITFVIVYMVTLSMNIASTIPFTKSYNDAVGMSSYAYTKVGILYNSILIQLNKGVDMKVMDEAQAAAYFSESLPAIDETFTGIFISCSILYTFFSFIFLQYFLFKKNGKDARKQYWDVVLGSLLSFTVQIGIVFLVLLCNGFRMALFTPNIILMLICQLLVMLAASAVYAWMIRRIRFRNILVPVLLVLSVVFYYGGIISEIYLSNPKTIESFDYLYEIDERYKNPDFDNYYDSETNQFFVEEDAYDPQIVPNEEYVGRVKRVGLIAGEILNPLANITRFTFDMEGVTAAWITILYMVKSMLLLVLVGCSFMKEKFDVRHN